MQKLGMFVHGLNVNDSEWRHIVWGKPPHLLGRVPRALLLLNEEYPHAEKILFGSGASERDGLKEGAYIIQYALSNWHALREFEAFKKHSRFEMWRFKRRIERIAEPETASYNTYSELEHGLPRLYALGIRRVVLVTESTHISRAEAHGFEILKKLGLTGKMWLVGEHSDSIPLKISPEEVVVFEPRADGQNQIVPNLRRIFRVSGDKRSEFNEKFANILTEVGA